MERSTAARWVCWGLWVAGLVGLPLGHAFLLGRIEPFYTPIYSFLWWPFILTTDFLVWRLRGTSLLHDRPREFWLLALWSVPVWLIFEMLNLRLHNWYYVQAPYLFSSGFVFLLFAFATVLPGVFEVMELLVGLIERFWPGGRIAGRPFVVTRFNLAFQISLGVAMLALVLVWPRTFFPLAWGFAFLICDPICYARRGRSLLGQLAAGDNTRLVALLGSGLVCGLVWELWNLHARTKWIYSVPFFDELKLGEMPLMGFFGFPAFVLECYALVNFIGLFRAGRNWELSREENALRRGMRAATAAVAALAAALFVPVAALLIIGHSVCSFSWPLDHFFQKELGPNGVAALRRAHVRYSHELLTLREPPPGMDPQVYAQMRRLCAMAEIKGMGLVYAELLEEAGVRTPAQLAALEPEEVVARIAAVSRSQARPPHLAWAKVWVHGARKAGNPESDGR